MFSFLGYTEKSLTRNTLRLSISNISMTSRGRTAPHSPSTQPNQSRAQTEANRDGDQRTRASRRQQTRAGRSEDTRASRRQETRGVSRRHDTPASGRTLKTGAGDRDGGKKSLFSRSREGRSGAAGEKLKADDVWNKFLDDKDVVRAPTAESRQSHVRTVSDGDTETDDSEYDSYDSEGKLAHIYFDKMTNQDNLSV